MKTLRYVFKNNWYVIASAFLLFFCSEILMGIMKYNTGFDDFYLYPYLGKLALRFVALVGGMCFACFAGGIFNHKAAGIMAFFSTCFTVIFSGVPFNEPVDYVWYRIGFIVALLSLSFYFINSCINSTVHTILYYVMIAALAVVSVDENEFFIVLITAIVIFATKRMIVMPKAALAINYICSILAIIALVSALVSEMDDYLGILYVEGSSAHPEAVLLTTQPFKTSQFFGEISDASSVYNLAKIFGYYGSAVGKVMCIIIAMFAVSAFVKCFDASGFARSGDIVATIAIAVKCAAGFFENFAINTASYSRIPILCDRIEGYLIVGILVGMLVSPRENLWLVRNYFNSIKEKDDEDESDDFDADFAEACNDVQH